MKRAFLTFLICLFLPASAFAGPLAWGTNKDGEVGNGTTSKKVMTPVAISLGDVTSMSVGNRMTYAAIGNTIYAWGNNSKRQLGYVGTGSSTPVAMADPCDTCGALVQLASGEMNGFALYANGEAFGWGNESQGALGNGRGGGNTATPTRVLLSGPAVQIDAGADHGIALMANDTVESWGDDTYGQLGDGSNGDSTVPVQALGVTGAVEVSAANNFSLILLGDGTGLGMGFNPYGQLGDGGTTNRNTPTPIAGLSGATAISAGGNINSNGHSMALLSDGTVVAWGHNVNGENGTGNYSAQGLTPLPVVGLTGVTFIDAGGAYSTALNVAGQVFEWGSNGNGSLGVGAKPKQSDTPLSVVGGISLLSAGPPGTVLAQ